ncbi:MAG: BrnT family toxin [Verrucomicrobiales bacterium]|nr:BrnT family toxin [Verrucomicrobiales bacterium]
MDFDWIDAPFDLSALPPKDIEETFEDPFSIKLLPDEGEEGGVSRYYNLGKTLNARGIFSVFWTDGKRYRVVVAREMTEVESDFYERKKMEEL